MDIVFLFVDKDDDDNGSMICVVAVVISRCHNCYDRQSIKTHSMKSKT